MDLHPEDNDRVDCGHYEYIRLAVPTPGWFLICRECRAKLLAASLRPKAGRNAHRGGLNLALTRLIFRFFGWLHNSAGLA